MRAETRRSLTKIRGRNKRLVFSMFLMERWADLQMSVMCTYVQGSFPFFRRDQHTAKENSAVNQICRARIVYS